MAWSWLEHVWRALRSNCLLTQTWRSGEGLVVHSWNAQVRCSPRLGVFGVCVEANNRGAEVIGGRGAAGKAAGVGGIGGSDSSQARGSGDGGGDLSKAHRAP